VRFYIQLSKLIILLITSLRIPFYIDYCRMSILYLSGVVSSDVDKVKVVGEIGGADRVSTRVTKFCVACACGYLGVYPEWSCLVVEHLQDEY